MCSGCVPILNRTLTHFKMVQLFSSQIVFFFPSTVLCLSPCSEALDSLKSDIDKSKGLKVASVRPLVLAAEENLHNMVVDLDKVVTKVRTNYVQRSDEKTMKDNL